MTKSNKNQKTEVESKVVVIPEGVKTMTAYDKQIARAAKLEEAAKAAKEKAVEMAKKAAEKAAEKIKSDAAKATKKEDYLQKLKDRLVIQKAKADKTEKQIKELAKFIKDAQKAATLAKLEKIAI